MTTSKMTTRKMTTNKMTTRKMTTRKMTTRKMANFIREEKLQWIYTGGSAFDTLNHDLLITKLHAYVFENGALLNQQMSQN